MTFSRHIFIKTNLSCNLNCRYCYDNIKTSISFNEDKILKEIDPILKKITPFGTKIKLVGGEPFLVFEKIQHFCNSLWGKNYDEKILIQITTNGTLVKGEIKDWLQSNRTRVECKISIDGDIESHNLNRSNSFDYIDKDFFISTWPECIVNMVITPETISNLSHNIIFLHSIGFRNITPIFAILTDWKDKYLERIFYNQLTSLSNFYSRHKELKKCGLLNFSLVKILDLDHNMPLCEIGRKIAFDIDGKIYPCHLFFPSACPNEKYNRIKNINFLKRDILEGIKCSSCKFLNLCHTCYAANLIERDGVQYRDMSICNYRKMSIYATAIHEYNRIIKLEKHNVEDLQKMQAIKYAFSDLMEIKKYIEELK